MLSCRIKIKLSYCPESPQQWVPYGPNKNEYPSYNYSRLLKHQSQPHHASYNMQTSTWKHLSLQRSTFSSSRYNEKPFHWTSLHAPLIMMGQTTMSKLGKNLFKKVLAWVTLYIWERIFFSIAASSASLFKTCAASQPHCNYIQVAALNYYHLGAEIRQLLF